MMDFGTMRKIVLSISYKPHWVVNVLRDGEGRPYVQLRVGEGSDAALDPHTGERVAWSSGKRYLSPYMCRQEVVGAVFDLIKGAELHETHEWFRYKGRSIYNPHLDPDVLAEVASKASSFVTRENAMSMEEAV